MFRLIFQKWYKVKSLIGSKNQCFIFLFFFVLKWQILNFKRNSLNTTKYKLKSRNFHTQVQQNEDYTITVEALWYALFINHGSYFTYKPFSKLQILIFQILLVVASIVVGSEPSWWREHESVSFPPPKQHSPIDVAQATFSLQIVPRQCQLRSSPRIWWRQIVLRFRKL